MRLISFCFVIHLYSVTSLMYLIFGYIGNVPYICIFYDVPILCTNLDVPYICFFVDVPYYCIFFDVFNICIILWYTQYVMISSDVPHIGILSLIYPNIVVYPLMYLICAFVSDTPKHCCIISDVPNICIRLCCTQ